MEKCLARKFALHSAYLNDCMTTATATFVRGGHLETAADSVFESDFIAPCARQTTTIAVEGVINHNVENKLRPQIRQPGQSYSISTTVPLDYRNSIHLTLS